MTTTQPDRGGGVPGPHSSTPEVPGPGGEDRARPEPGLLERRRFLTRSALAGGAFAGGAVLLATGCSDDERSGSATTTAAPLGEQTSSEAAFAVDTRLAPGTILVAGDVELRRADHGSAVEAVDRGAVIWTAGGQGSGPGQFNGVGGAAIGGDGTYWVVDTGNARVNHLDAAGTPLAPVGSAGSGPGQLVQPVDVAVDGAGRVYVADAVGRVVTFGPDGTPGSVFGTQGTGEDQLLGIAAIAVDGEDLFVLETGRPRVVVFGTDGAGRRTFDLPADAVPVDLVVDGTHVWVATTDGLHRVGPDGSDHRQRTDLGGTVEAVHLRADGSPTAVVTPVPTANGAS